MTLPPINLEDVAQVTVGGAAQGSVYALTLVGILLVFRVSKAVNFGHGQVAMFGALFSFYAHRAGLPLWLTIALGILIGGLISLTIDVFVMRRMPEGVIGYDLIATVGAFLLLTAAAEIVFGTQSRLYPSLLNDRFVELVGASLNWNDLLVIFGTAALVTSILLVLKYTSLGLQVRASAEAPAVAESLGIRVQGIRTATWCVAGIIGVVAGILIASRVSVNPYLVTPFLIKAFIAGIIGGLNRFVAPVMVAVGLGIYEAWIVFLFGSTLRIPAVFLMIILAMLVVPMRFLREEAEARA